MIFISSLLELLAFLSVPLSAVCGPRRLRAWPTVYMNNMGADQLVCPCNLFGAFVVRILNNVSVLVISNIIRLYLLPEAKQDSMDFSWRGSYMCAMSFRSWFASFFDGGTGWARASLNIGAILQGSWLLSCTMAKGGNISFSGNYTDLLLGPTPIFYLRGGGDVWKVFLFLEYRGSGHQPAE